MTAAGGARAPFATKAAAPTAATRVPMFAAARRAGGGATGAEKAPFAAAAKEGKARAKTQLSFKGFSAAKSSQQPKRDEPKGAKNTKVDQRTAGAASIPAKREFLLPPNLSKPQPSVQKLPSKPKGTKPLPSVSQRFQFKPSRGSEDGNKTLMMSGVQIKKTTSMATSAPLTSVGKSLVDPRMLSSEVSAQETKKRHQPREFAVAAGKLKKSRVETPKTVGSTISRVPALPHIVSPEPRRRPEPQLNTDGVAMKLGVPEHDTSANEGTSERSLPRRDPRPSNTHPNGRSDTLDRPSFPLQFYGSNPGVFVSAQEEAMATYDPCDERAEVENESFLKRIREIQIFVDSVNAKQQSVQTSVLDSHASVTECLLEVVNDLTAIKGGVPLRQLDDIARTAEQDFDGKSLSEVVFP